MDGSLSASERDAVMRDLGLLLEALGLGAHARPVSPHEVMMMCIAEAARLKKLQLSRPAYAPAGGPPEPLVSPPGRASASATDDDRGEIQVVMTLGIQEPFREWLKSRGLHLFRIPVSDDDLPTYGIGIG